MELVSGFVVRTKERRVSTDGEARTDSQQTGTASEGLSLSPAELVSGFVVRTIERRGGVRTNRSQKGETFGTAAEKTYGSTVSSSSTH